MTKLLLHLSMMIGRVRTNPHQLHLPLPQRACIARDAFSVPHQCDSWEALSVSANGERVIERGLIEELHRPGLLRVDVEERGELSSRLEYEREIDLLCQEIKFRPSTPTEESTELCRRYYEAHPDNFCYCPPKRGDEDGSIIDMLMGGSVKLPVVIASNLVFIALGFFLGRRNFVSMDLSLAFST